MQKTALLCNQHRVSLAHIKMIRSVDVFFLFVKVSFRNCFSIDIVTIGRAVTLRKRLEQMFDFMNFIKIKKVFPPSFLLHQNFKLNFVTTNVSIHQDLTKDLETLNSFLTFVLFMSFLVIQFDINGILREC